MRETNLTCPWCKGEVKIVVTDHEGNIKGFIGSDEAKEYEADPWSGLAYQLWHDTTMTNGDCPIAHDSCDWIGLGCYTYDTVEEAIEAWNGKAEEKKTYQIENLGCDDITRDTFNLTKSEHDFLKKIFDELNLNSKYTCQPVITITEPGGNYETEI